jgi:hypothetical protein
MPAQRFASHSYLQRMVYGRKAKRNWDTIQDEMVQCQTYLELSTLIVLKLGQVKGMYTETSQRNEAAYAETSCSL